MEHRRRQRRDLAGLERDRREHATDRGEGGWGVPSGPLRRPGGAAGENDDRGLLGGLGSSVLTAALNQLGQRLVGTARRFRAVRVGAKCPDSAQCRTGHLHRVGVLVVVDDDPRALTLGDVADLRSGELRIQQDGARPNPGAGIVRDQKPAVVAGQNGHPVTATHAQPQQTVGDRVDGVVELGEGHRALVIDDRRAVRIPAGVQRGDHADFTPAHDIGAEGGQVLRRLEPKGAGSDHLLQVVQFGRAALGVLTRLVQCTGG